MREIFFFWHGVANSFVPRYAFGPVGPGPGKFDGRSVEDSSSRAVHAFHGPLIYYGGRSNKQITSRPVIRRLVAEMTSAGFQRFPRNHAEYHFLPKRGTMRSPDAIVPQKKKKKKERKRKEEIYNNTRGR